MEKDFEHEEEFKTTDFEEMINRATFEGMREKTFIDKVLNREEAKRLQELARKEDLNRSELLEMLYLLSGVELKLVNFDEYDRYLLGKFFAWIRDFVSKTEITFDYIEDLNDMIRKEKDESKKKNLIEAKEVLTKIKKLDMHNVKFLADVFLFLCRSTLGLSATGFETLTTSRFEYHYPVAKPEEERRFFWRR